MLSLLVSNILTVKYFNKNSNSVIFYFLSSMKHEIRNVPVYTRKFLSNQ